jgi:hypothetical protein
VRSCNSQNPIIYLEQCQMKDLQHRVLCPERLALSLTDCLLLVLVLLLVCCCSCWQARCFVAELPACLS